MLLFFGDSPKIKSKIVNYYSVSCDYLGEDETTFYNILYRG